jgi:hypothetical protein
MAGSFSDYLENAVLNHVFKKTSLSQPTNLYVALSTATLTDTATGTSLNGEVSGGSYARKGCNTWDSASGGATQNTGPITFVSATAAWGTIKSFAVCDHLTTGNVLVWGTLSVNKAIGTGDTAKFATGAIDITLA